MKAAVWQSRAVWRTSQASPPSGVHSPDFTIPSIALYYPDFAIPYPLYYPDFTIPSVLSRFYHTIPSALSRCYHTKPMHFTHHTTPRQKLARASQVPSMVRHGVPSPDQNVCGCQKYLTSLVGVNKRSILYFCVNLSYWQKVLANIFSPKSETAHTKYKIWDTGCAKRTVLKDRKLVLGVNRTQRPLSLLVHRTPSATSPPTSSPVPLVHRTPPPTHLQLTAPPSSTLRVNIYSLVNIWNSGHICITTWVPVINHSPPCVFWPSPYMFLLSRVPSLF